MDYDEDIYHRALISLVAEPGDPRVAQWVSDHGPRTTLQIIRREYPSHVADIDSANVEGALEKARHEGVTFITPDEEGYWPYQLASLYGEQQAESGGVPVGLWVKGDVGLLSSAHNVAVVGSRSATTYGASVAAEIGSRLASQGHNVVSGGAYGIDQAAMRAALAVGGKVICVLACGPDRAYPAAHRSLIDYCARQGVVVSEAPVGQAPTRRRFLARNRLIAGLSAGTVVVEAAARSGALSTAEWTGHLGRPLMGVPGPVTSACSQGVHQLIRAGEAVLVTNGDEVIEELNPTRALV